MGSATTYLIPWSQVAKYNLALRADSTTYFSTSPRLFQALGKGLKHASDLTVDPCTKQFVSVVSAH